MTREELHALRAKISADNAEREQREADEPVRRPVMRKSDAGDGLIFKTNYDALVDVPEAAVEPSDDDALAEPVTGDEMIEILVEERRRLRGEFERALAARDATIAKLEGKVEALLAIVGKSGGDVVTLPGRKHHA